MVQVGGVCVHDGDGDDDDGRQAVGYKSLALRTEARAGGTDLERHTHS